jgi:hypothetical protein
MSRSNMLSLSAIDLSFKWINQTYKQLFDNNAKLKKLMNLNKVPTTNDLKSFVLLRVVANFLNSLANLVPSIIKMQSE